MHQLDGNIFRTDNIELYLQDAIEGMKNMPENSIDLAIVDPPYGASTKATWALPDKHSLGGFGGAWNLLSENWDLISGSESLMSTLTWIKELKRVVKPSGSIWIHATYHNSGFVNVACQLLELEIINEVAWYKRNAFPNLSKRRLTASHESIYWVHTGGKKRTYRFNYEDVKAAHFPEDNLKEAGKQLRTVWDIPNNKDRSELKNGSHPTQKPLRVTRRMLLTSGLRGGKLLVPFAGSGTEIIAGLEYGMTCIAFENDKKSFDLAINRINDFQTTENSKLVLNFAHDHA